MKWAAVNDDIGITIWVDDTLRVSPYGFKQSNLKSLQSDHIRVLVRKVLLTCCSHAAFRLKISTCNCFLSIVCSQEVHLTVKAFPCSSTASMLPALKCRRSTFCVTMSQEADREENKTSRARKDLCVTFGCARENCSNPTIPLTQYRFRCASLVMNSWYVMGRWLGLRT